MGVADDVVADDMATLLITALAEQVMSFPTEEEVLLRWRDLVLETDPDIIIGYNISNFDLPYLIDRAVALKLNKFPYWGRMRNKCGPRCRAPSCA